MDSYPVAAADSRADLQCQFEGHEMVLTQVMEEGAADESFVRDLLKVEYKLLCEGDAIKEQFDKWVTECGIAVPSE